MGRIGFSELLLILVVVLVLFGAKRLPEIGNSLGKAIREFQKALKGEDDKKNEDRKDV
ncbi:MAG: twin-arginine translocase TatA/TatE family subunit [Candidatus Omnitrophica bacterium]|nr:twin-arginine translocase TatA/TatE family subunit [Candidatus Omnitrophota bacterium]